MTSKKRMENFNLRVKNDPELKELLEKEKLIRECVFGHKNLDYTNTDYDYNRVLIKRRLKELGWDK